MLKIRQPPVFNSLNSEQIYDSRDGKTPEEDVVDDGDEVDGDGAVGEEQARRLLQLALKDLKQGARLNHGEGSRARLVGRGRPY